MIPRIKALTTLNKIVLQYYVEHLATCQQAQDYLYDRIPKKICDKFYLGYAPKSNKFIEYLNDHNVKTKDVKDLGIASFDYENNAYPFFRHRIMIPIFHAGIIVGFSGRTLGEVTATNPKYLNSKSSVLYKKNEILFGLQHNRKHIAEQNVVFVVEGYFDVIGTYAYGLKTCVATCGISFNKEQANLLKRYTKNVYVMMDGDSAGIEAAKKARKILINSYCYAGTVLLPKGEDPDTYVKKYGPNVLDKLKVID